jgi:hypothetical protein
MAFGQASFIILSTLLKANESSTDLHISANAWCFFPYPPSSPVMLRPGLRQAALCLQLEALNGGGGGTA